MYQLTRLDLLSPQSRACNNIDEHVVDSHSKALVPQSRATLEDTSVMLGISDDVTDPHSETLLR
jgi:hypothetical protein